MSSTAISDFARNCAGFPRPWRPVIAVLATGIACTIGTLAYAYGEQPIRGDGTEYLRLGEVIARQGLGEYSSDVRTYGYPAFLALLISLVGSDPASLHSTAFVVQLFVYILGSALGAVRIGRALGSSTLGLAIFVVTVLNPFLLFHSVQLLTDVLSAVLVYLAVVFSLPQEPRESRWRVGVSGILAFLLAGLSVMVRPANLMLVPALVLVWIVRARIFRDLPLAAVPAMVLALALPFGPQFESNRRAFEVPQPLIVRSLYAEHLTQGFRHAKYVSLGISGLPTRAIYYNPFFPPAAESLAAAQAIRDYPVAYAATLAIHAFALIDQDYPFTYIRDLDPWYRWPLSALNYLFVAGAVVGLATGLRRQRDDDRDVLRRPFTLLAILIVVGALVAVYLPSEVENRFSLPLYPLLTVPCVLAAVAVRRQVRTARRWLLLVAVALCVVLTGASLSMWLQRQSPVLTAIRALQELPAPERPVAALDGELPKMWTVGETQTFEVRVTNLGEQTWSSTGFYPVTLAVRFAAQKESQHVAISQMVGQFPRRYVRLPADVPPNTSLVALVEVLPPPIPGRYVLEIQIFRHGLPDPDQSLERMVRVER